MKWWSVAVLAVGLPACRPGTAADTAQAHPPGEAWLTPQEIQDAGIVVTPVGEQRIGSSVVCAGHVTFDDARVTHVFSPVTGRIVQVLAQLGERVQRGSALVAIASPDLGQAASDFVKAKADLAAAEREYKRQKELYDAHAGAQRDLEAAESSYEKAKAEVERSRAKVRLLAPDTDGQVTQDFVLRSTIAGEVVARFVNPGTEVMGQYSQGSAVELFTVGELDSVWVLGDLFEVDLRRVSKGDSAIVRLISYPDKAFTGTVDWISGTLDPVTHTAKVRCVIPNPKRELRPEMLASVTISVGSEKALAVRRSAVLRLGDDTVVFVEQGPASTGQIRFERRVVAVREDMEGDLVPVTKGLVPNEKVVTTGAILLAGMI